MDFHTISSSLRTTTSLLFLHMSIKPRATAGAEAGLGTRHDGGGSRGALVAGDDDEIHAAATIDEDVRRGDDAGAGRGPCRVSGLALPHGRIQRARAGLEAGLGVDSERVHQSQNEILSKLMYHSSSGSGVTSNQASPNSLPVQTMDVKSFQLSREVIFTLFQIVVPSASRILM